MPRCAIHVVACVLALALASCAMTMRVHQEDMQSWVGVPVAELDMHPIFLTMHVVRTRTSDGTEIRNYVNAKRRFLLRRRISLCRVCGHDDIQSVYGLHANIRRLQQYFLHQGRCRHAILADRYWRYALLHDRATEAGLCRCREHSMKVSALPLPIRSALSDSGVSGM
jgi:hypothetical protein